jgi:hypothetical protein
LLIAIAGWFYLFYSRAAHKLGAIEEASVNNRRIRLRQVNGFVLLLLAIALYAGFHTVNTEPPTMAFALVWLGVMVLLMVSVILGMVDLRLTLRLRRFRKIDLNSQRDRDGDET